MIALDLGANLTIAFGQISQETYGNGIVSTISHNDPLGRITGISSTSGSTTLQGWGYSWDTLGNLVSRADNSSSGNVSESFGYDLLNRLISAQVTNSSGVQPAITYGYDALGDITSKSDTGSYAYGSGAHVHAVTSISGPVGGSYGYDPDGNMTNRNGTTIVWNSLNMPTQITESSSNASSFAYAPDKHRYYQSAMIAGVTETTVYAGAFEAVTTGGVTTYRYHLSADSREVAEVDLSNSGSSVVEKISYVLSDHLGSTDVVETTDVNGNVLSTTQMSFSAWGGRREPNTWLLPVSTSEAQTDHNADRYGFTHQEMLDNVGIVHMNGRIYDPNLGRFLSVDPVFEFPTNTQSLNPYSYVLNNPLSMTDPTGYVADSCGTGKTSCTDSITVKTTAHELGSHIATHGNTTFTGTLDKNGNLHVSASGNGFGLGQTAEVTVDSHGGGNGAQTSQTAASAQQQPTQHTDIGSPAQTHTSSSSLGSNQGKTNTIALDQSLPSQSDNTMSEKQAFSTLQDEFSAGYSTAQKFISDYEKITLGLSRSLYDFNTIKWDLEPGANPVDKVYGCCSPMQYFGDTRTVAIYALSMARSRDGFDFKRMVDHMVHEFRHDFPENQALFNEYPRGMRLPWAERPWEEDANRFMLKVIPKSFDPYPGF